jgi:septum formation protein
MTIPPLILASGSPRRRELLQEMGVTFEVVTADVRELDAASSDLSPLDMALENARLKAAAVAKIKPGRWVLGADTIVALDRHILGKPASLDQARDYLRLLSGKTHEVITGCVLFAPDATPEIFHDISRVTFHSLTDSVIDHYLAAVNVLDKAGAYALQEQGESIIQRVEGSRTNVIGLPVELLEKVFIRHGLL